MILVIDNYDSFTFNLVQYLGELRSDIHVVKNDELSFAEVEALHPTHMVISPGPGLPQKAGMSLKLIEHFYQKFPILGVCLGHQAMAMVFGGSLKQAPTLFHGKTSRIYHEGKGILKNVENPFCAMRYNSWIIDHEKPIHSDIETIAYTEDNIPMAIQHKKYFVFGVQFHPESILTPEGKKILKNFLEISYDKAHPLH